MTELRLIHCGNIAEKKIQIYSGLIGYQNRINYKTISLVSEFQRGSSLR